MVKNNESKSKVLFIMHLPPPVHGAATVGMYIKTSALINTEIEAEYINLATTVNLDQIGKGGINKLFIFLRLVKNIVKTLRKKHFDLCYITLTASGPGFYKDFVIVSVLKFFRCNIIYHFHNKGIKQASTSKINNILYRYVFKNAKAILLSPHLYSDISLYLKEENVFYCPNGTVSDINIKRNIAPALQRCKLLFLSNMMIEKGAYVLLDAVKILNDKSLFFECHFVGGWSDIIEDDFNRQVIEKGVENVVFVHGPKYGSEKADFFNSADVFILPTFYHYEAFPLSILEAMQYSLPVVSTPEGGISDIIVENETGFLVPQKDAAKLADKLMLLIQDKELRFKMGVNGKKRYEELFTLDKFEKRFIEIINEATN